MNAEALADFLESENIEYRQNEPMRAHTTFKIGGEADIFIIPASPAALIYAVKKCNELEIPYFILGNGSNLLVSDGGIEGAVISLSGINGISSDGEKITCGAGAMLSSVCLKALSLSLTGLEFAYGIPGTAGGALYMNAGAYGGQTADVIESAECLTATGEIKTLKKEDMRLGYRSSVFKNGGLIIISLTLALKKGDKTEIKAEMDELLNRRKQKQPLEYPSAGSTFKRPEGYFAGALIEKNGLKGSAVGGAQVSEKHAGFVINRGGATAADVKALIEKIQKKVFENDGVMLEPEVIFTGRNGD